METMPAAMAYFIGTPAKVRRGVVMLAPPSPVMEPTSPARNEMAKTVKRSTMRLEDRLLYFAVCGLVFC